LEDDLKIVESKDAESILKLFLSEKILELKPVIAGGFVVALYNNIINAPQSKKEKNIEGIRKSFLQKKYMINHPDELKFGDIDMWFLKDNPIWGEHPVGFIVGGINPDVDNFDLFGNQVLKVNDGRAKTYRSASINYQHHLHTLGLGAHCQIQSSTPWANTFKNDCGVVIQFVKRQYDDIQKLFNHFDILNCCAAYHDGMFYFADGFTEAFDNKTLSVNSNFANRNIAANIISANRAFKYASRYKIEFSKEACENVVEILFEAEELSKKIATGNLGSELEAIEGVTMEDGYGRTFTVKNTELMIDMISQLFHYFERLIHMENFNEEYIFTFLNFKDSGIIKRVKKYLEVQEKIARGEPEAIEVGWNDKYYGFF
jgi:hypothetical protein